MKAIITTAKDLSANCFEKQHGWDIYFYDELPVGDIYYDTIYLRDPFDNQSISSRAKSTSRMPWGYSIIQRA